MLFLCCFYDVVCCHSQATGFPEVDIFEYGKHFASRQDDPVQAEGGQGSHLGGGQVIG